MERTFWYYSYMVSGIWGICMGNNITWIDGTEFPVTRETRRACIQNNGVAILNFWRKISEAEYRSFAQYCEDADGGSRLPPVVKSWSRRRTSPRIRSPSLRSPRSPGAIAGTRSARSRTRTRPRDFARVRWETGPGTSREESRVEE